MLKAGQKRPNTPNTSSGETGGTQNTVGCWPNSVQTVILTALEDGTLNFSIGGGSDSGEFAYVSEINKDKVNIISGVLNESDTILEIHGQKVAGYTRRDTVAWLNHCCRSGSPVTLKTVPAGSITQDLRLFLNTRFQKGSVDHDLQNTIRDNLYLRTVPVTTRTPRDGEVNGVDYTFLSPQAFQQLEESGSLLESGIYEGNHYGTPKPSKEPHVPVPQSGGGAVVASSSNPVFPGAHPSSEGKRRRNRSNVEAMAAKNAPEHPTNGPTTPVDLSPKYERGPPEHNFYHGDPNNDPLLLDLGPLPPKWEKAYTEKGEVYFIDHNSSTSHWLDPRLSKFQKKSLEDCTEDELPYGWERIDDPLYGTYYIDHVNRLTQYENPVIQAKNAKSHGSRSSEIDEDESLHLLPPPNGNPSNLSHRSNHNNDGRGGERENTFFTLNPHELMGERLHSTLVKSLRGLGFTIVGGDDSKEEFLQIKSVVPNGPAWLEGKLQTGDVLVYVNEKCVLGYTHHDMVSVFQSISPGETVRLEVCRGYPLPFDPNDPNTEVVTTVAVNAPDSDPVEPHLYSHSQLDQDMYRLKLNTCSFLESNDSVKSLPELYSGEKASEGSERIERPSSTDLILGADTRPEYLTIPIVKGAMGFGFTIADSAYGQKVKKILDRQRCKNLMEGDILVDINQISVRNMCHSEVVQVLKDCTRNEEATVTVQRGVLRPIKKEDTKYRSKTPTVEMYGTRPKEIVAGRPKTPLVDTRNRAKTPTQEDHNNTPDPETWKYPPDPSYYNGYCLDSLPGYYVKRKESTSFEHEQPHSALSEQRYPGRGMQLRQSLEYAESVVTLMRQESGFGFRIVGGTEEGSQVGAMVSIGHIVPGGAADLDGRLCTGDEIVSVDTQCVMNTSHHHVVQLMGKAAVHGKVTLGIRRRQQSFHNFTRASEIGYPYDVTVKRRENEGFGFVIISSLNKSGSTIGRIIEGSPAERCGQLHLGDHILAVNHIDIMSLHHGDIVNLIKDSGYSVTLTIGPPLDDASSTASISASHREVEEEVDGGGDGEETQYHAVELSRGTRGFGFSIRGGREFQNMALYVLQIADNGPAALDGRLQIGDQIIEINGINTKNMTHAEAIEIIRNGGPVVRLLVQRGGRVPLLPGGGDASNNGGVVGVQQQNSLICLNMNSPPYWDSHYTHSPS